MKASNSAQNGSLSIKVSELATAAAKWSSANIRDAVDQSFSTTQALSSQEDKLDGTLSKTEYAIKINGKEINKNTEVDSLDRNIRKINRDTNVTKSTGLVNGENKDEAYITFEDDDDFLNDIFKIDIANNIAVNSTAAQDAEVTINELETTRSSNVFSVNGIEVTLLQATGIEAIKQNKIEEEINAFVAKRELIMTELQTNSFTSEELERNRATMKKILEYDTIILARMNELKDEAARQMNKISTGRTQKNAYDASYASDGVYVDKKK